ncbi:hypothetical protein CY35_11G042800 [Sphagnum magellanicum]|nr:hypothetical protein CY35_11G042800 [Sphagnum magellanicum]
MGELCGPPGGNAMVAHLTGMHSAIKMLNSRIRILHHHLVSIQKGEAPYDHSLLRQVSSLIRKLPAIDFSRFQDDFLMVCTHLRWVEHWFHVSTSQSVYHFT